MLENIPAPPHPQAGGRHFRLHVRVEGGELRKQFRRFPRPASPVQGPGQFPTRKLHPVPPGVFPPGTPVLTIPLPIPPRFGSRYPYRRWPSRGPLSPGPRRANALRLPGLSRSEGSSISLVVGIYAMPAFC